MEGYLVLERAGTRRWLEDYPWEEVIGMLAGFWHVDRQKLESCEIHKLWEREYAQKMPLAKALALCRTCQTAKPFGKYDCESFVIIARDIVKPFLGKMSSTLAAAVVVIVGDYVRGCDDEAEMRQTLHLILEKFEE